MNRNELYYRKTVGAIGATMLLFLLLINLVGIIYEILPDILSILLPTSSVVIACQTVYAAGYLLAFMLPVLLLKGLIGKAGYVYQPMQSSLVLTPWIFLMIPATVTVIFSAAYLNTAMVDIFNYSDFLWDMLEVTDEPLPVYRWVLEFIVMCVVPGFCEEFLFRGAIQTNLRPFGRVNAVMISSLLFALMHQNAGQILYAFVAGIFLGVIYEKTQSIWFTTILHVFNNFISVFESMIANKVQTMFESDLYQLLFEAILLALGVLSLVVLIMKHGSGKPDLHGGVFGKQIQAAEGYAACPIAPRRAVKLFLTPTMVIFLVMCTLQIFFLVLLSLGYGLYEL